MPIRRNRLLPLHIVKVPIRLHQPQIFRPDLSMPLRAAGGKVVREPWLKRHRVFDLVDLVGREADAQRVDVALQVIFLAAAADGEDVGGLVHDVRERDARDDGSLPLGDLLEHVRHGDLVVARGPHLPAVGLLPLRLALEVAATECAPRGEAHALGPAHRDDFALKVLLRGGPEALVDDELAQPVVAGVLVGFGDDPGRGIADA